MSSGIVSVLARSGDASGLGRGYFIQTDAPINPGNSGGVLIYVKGDLIGINTSILCRSGGSNGIGFAVPANLVGQFVEQARAGQDTFQRPWIGMAGLPVNADLAESLGLVVPEGILISDLHPESPFAVSGLQVGDIIAAVDELPVNTPDEMVFRMSVVGIGGHWRSQGVFVTDPGRFGVRVGLKTGDFVLKINDREIDRPEDVRRADKRVRVRFRT